MTQCDRCHKEIPKDNYNDDNACYLAISGGYSSFLDVSYELLEDPSPADIVDGMTRLPLTDHTGFTESGVCRQCGNKPLVTLCHECAHKIMEYIGVDVHNWHTHQIDGGQHPDHNDWAYTIEGTRYELKNEALDTLPRTLHRIPEYVVYRYSTALNEDFPFNHQPTEDEVKELIKFIDEIDEDIRSAEWERAVENGEAWAMGDNNDNQA